MENVITWFELPVTDMERAKKFYAEVLQTTFTDDEMDGYQLAIFDCEEGALSGMLIQGKDYEPNATGTTPYFNGGADLDEPLARAEQQGATILVPKTALDEGKIGYFAQFLDSEGNRVGLYSLPQ